MQLLPSRPKPETLRWLKEQGIRTVIDLRRFHYRDEGEQAKREGMRFEHIPMRASAAPSEAQIGRFLSLVTDPSLQPVYVHCAQGVDRTGAMIAVYRMQVQGWSNRDAFAEMTSFGAHRIWWDLRNFVLHFEPH